MTRARWRAVVEFVVLMALWYGGLVWAMPH